MPMPGSSLLAIAAAGALVWATAPASAAVAPAPPRARECVGAGQVPTPATAARARAALSCLLAAARAERDLPALRPDPRLRRAAQGFAAVLKPDRPLTHAGPRGSSPLDRISAVRYAQTFSAAETLGRGRGEPEATPAGRMAAWLAQASTRRLLLSARYRDAGIGVVTRGAVTTYVVELARKGAARSASASSKRASGSSRRAPNSSRS